MKKFAVITLAVVLVGAVSIGAFAYRGGMYDNNTQTQMYGQRGGMMYNNQQNQAYGPRGGMMYNNQQMPNGRRGGMRGRQQFNNGTAPCGAICPYADGTQVQPGQAPQTSQMITEEKVTEVAGEFVTKYFPDYTVKSIEKDDWRPMYFVTIQGANDAEQVMTIHGFSGQVMNVFPKIVEESDAE